MPSSPKPIPLSSARICIICHLDAKNITSSALWNTIPSGWTVSIFHFLLLLSIALFFFCSSAASYIHWMAGGKRQEAVAMSFTYLQLLHYYIKNTFETVNVANWYAALRSVVAGANKARNVSSPMDIYKARNSTMCRMYKCTADDNGIWFRMGRAYTASAPATMNILKYTYKWI